ncbi:MAG: hypothetical protein K6A65_05970, partial [Succinivibrionaceae bacterium]|nr:hypothetical protein [Succinivibrionaceae bacterium]
MDMQGLLGLAQRAGIAGNLTLAASRLLGGRMGDRPEVAALPLILLLDVMGRRDLCLPMPKEGSTYSLERALLALGDEARSRAALGQGQAAEDLNAFIRAARALAPELTVDRVGSLGDYIGAPGSAAPLIWDGGLLYVRRYHHCESEVARMALARGTAPALPGEADGTAR